MRIVIAGGHGKIALLLEERLTRAGHASVGLIRNPDHAADLEEAGAVPVVLDLESTHAAELAPHLRGADGVVFAAGAGPGSGEARKETVDRAASVLLADAAEMAGVRRFVQISSMGAGTEPPEGTDPVFAAYLRAKGAAEADLRRRRHLEWTILRPGRLTDEPATGRVELAERVARGAVPRDDVAAVVLELLRRPETAGRTLELVGGPTPIVEAVRSVTAPTRA
ncbi:SDR family oxidoreductase [Allostreptomyces psammosilenae]|uniref:Uncharacterized protein YbjT (DUF2867 family) n=1 Tax=Allostreptomyces psammosilenae TaxID=1892865 RepID=A0A852ZXA5_9ACTN|nr:SDR family oxidoreductase [Allostreptomyces psammosilenae]NYI05880.1 uncharacterized protein YbjT (DUF2867 family) [Allostreptomyces psammosilenae]